MVTHRLCILWQLMEGAYQTPIKFICSESGRKTCSDRGTSWSGKMKIWNCSKWISVPDVMSQKSAQKLLTNVYINQLSLETFYPFFVLQTCCVTKFNMNIILLNFTCIWVGFVYCSTHVFHGCESTMLYWYWVQRRLLGAVWDQCGLILS